jgi:hypothetical protein
MYLPSVVEAKYRGDFRIHLTFSDSSSKTVDFRPWLKGPVFTPLKQAGYFRRFFLDGGTLAEWRRHRSRDAVRSSRRP